jgi:methyl-accepting chemotaxis protein
VERNAGDVAQRASANKERAEHQAQQMQVMKETVEAMRATAAEVAGASEARGKRRTSPAATSPP